jgi:hypothetical protein
MLFCNLYKVVAQSVSQSADEAAEVDTDVKQYVDTVVTQQHQKTAFARCHQHVS